MSINPFPGMNPYLESAVYWRGLHTLCIAEMTAQLNQQMPHGFVARVEERCYITAQQSIYADVAIRQTGTPETQRGQAAILTAPTGTLTLLAEEQTERFIEIIALVPTRRVVTVIELLSPANKARIRRGVKVISASRSICWKATSLYSK